MAATLLTKVQIGRETTAGTAVAADHIIRAPGAWIDDQREIEHVPEDVGYLSKVNRTNEKKQLAYLSMPMQASFEDSAYMFDAGIKAVASGSTDTGGSGKIYTFTFPTTSANTIGNYTIEAADGTQEYEMAYGFLDSFTLSGSGGNPIEATFNLFGRTVSKDTVTGAISLAEAEVINFSKGKLYMDAVAGTIGTTQVENSWLDFNLNVKTGWQPVFTGEGNLYFTDIINVGPEITLDLTLEHDSNGVARYDDFIAQTARQIRLLFEGSALTTAGATYTYKSLLIDLSAKLEKVGPIQSRDGNNVVPMTFRAAYDSTCAKFATITLVNELASL